MNVSIIKKEDKNECMHAYIYVLIVYGVNELPSLEPCCQFSIKHLSRKI